MEEVLTVVLASIPGLLTGAGAVWIGFRRQRIADRRSDRELSQDETDTVVAGFRRLMEDRRKAHERDMDRVDRQLGQVIRELAHCQKGHRRSEIVNARLIEFMRSRDLMTETQEHQLLREEDSDDSDFGEDHGGK